MKKANRSKKTNKIIQKIKIKARKRLQEQFEDGVPIELLFLVLIALLIV